MKAWLKGIIIGLIIAIMNQSYFFYSWNNSNQKNEVKQIDTNKIAVGMSSNLSFTYLILLIISSGFFYSIIGWIVGYFYGRIFTEGYITPAKRGFSIGVIVGIILLVTMPIWSDWLEENNIRLMNIESGGMLIAVIIFSMLIISTGLLGALIGWLISKLMGVKF